MRVSKRIKGKCIGRVYDRGRFVRGVNCSDWTGGQVSKERYDYVMDRIFEGVE